MITKTPMIVSVVAAMVLLGGCANIERVSSSPSATDQHVTGFQITRLRAAEYLVEVCVPNSVAGEPLVQMVSKNQGSQRYFLQLSLVAHGESKNFWGYTLIVNLSELRTTEVSVSASFRATSTNESWTTEEFDLNQLVTEFENRRLVLDSQDVKSPCERPSPAMGGRAR